MITIILVLAFGTVLCVMGAGIEIWRDVLYVERGGHQAEGKEVPKQFWWAPLLRLASFLLSLMLIFVLLTIT